MREFESYPHSYPQAYSQSWESWEALRDSCGEQLRIWSRTRGPAGGDKHRKGSRGYESELSEHTTGADHQHVLHGQIMQDLLAQGESGI